MTTQPKYTSNTVKNSKIDNTLLNYFAGKHFLIVIGTLKHIGGAEKQTVRLGRFIKDKLDAEVSVLAWSGGGRVERFLTEARIPFFIFPLKEKTPKAKKVFDLIELIRFIRSKIKPNYIIPFGGAFNSKIIGNIWTHTGARYACWNQEDEGRALCKTRFEQRALIKACDIVSNSYEGQRALAEGYDIPIDRIKVYNNGTIIPDTISLRRFWREKLGIPANAKVVSMIANIHRYKDHKTLFYAWREVQEHFNNKSKQVKLLLAGRPKDTLTELKVLGFDLNVSNSVKFLGSIDQINELILESDLVVHSSNTEGSPQAVCEAMSLGKPVVGTDISGIRQALGQEYAKYCLSEPNKPNDLSEKIIHLLENIELAEKIGQANLARIEKEFSMEQMVEFFLTLIWSYTTHDHKSISME